MSSEARKWHRSNRVFRRSYRSNDRGALRDDKCRATPPIDPWVYDHVEPPAAIRPDTHDKAWTFDRLGVGVPPLLISPWVGARPEKTQFDHTRLLRYLVNKWGWET